MLCTTDLLESSRLDGRVQGGGAIGRRGGDRLARMMQISLLKMGQRFDDDGSV